MVCRITRVFNAMKEYRALHEWQFFPSLIRLKVGFVEADLSI